MPLSHLQLGVERQLSAYVCSDIVDAQRQAPGVSIELFASDSFAVQRLWVYCEPDSEDD